MRKPPGKKPGSHEGAGHHEEPHKGKKPIPPSMEKLVFQLSEARAKRQKLEDILQEAAAKLPPEEFAKLTVEIGRQMEKLNAIINELEGRLGHKPTIEAQFPSAVHRVPTLGELPVVKPGDKTVVVPSPEPREGKPGDKTVEVPRPGKRPRPHETPVGESNLLGKLVQTGSGEEEVNLAHLLESKKPGKSIASRETVIMLGADGKPIRPRPPKKTLTRRKFIGWVGGGVATVLGGLGLGHWLLNPKSVKPVKPPEPPVIVRPVKPTKPPVKPVQPKPVQPRPFEDIGKPVTRNRVWPREMRADRLSVNVLDDLIYGSLSRGDRERLASDFERMIADPRDLEFERQHETEFPKGPLADFFNLSPEVSMGFALRKTYEASLVQHALTYGIEETMKLIDEGIVSQVRAIKAQKSDLNHFDLFKLYERYKGSAIVKVDRTGRAIEWVFHFPGDNFSRQVEKRFVRWLQAQPIPADPQRAEAVKALIADLSIDYRRDDPLMLSRNSLSAQRITAYSDLLAKFQQIMHETIDGIPEQRLVNEIREIIRGVIFARIRLHAER